MAETPPGGLVCRVPWPGLHSGCGGRIGKPGKQRGPGGVLLLLEIMRGGSQGAGVGDTRWLSLGYWGWARGPAPTVGVDAAWGTELGGRGWASGSVVRMDVGETWAEGRCLGRPSEQRGGRVGAAA